MKRLFEEARARKLDRVAAAYAVIAWVVVQAASIAFPAFGAPGWALQAVIIAAILGLPLALAAAWRMARPSEGQTFTRLKRYDTALLVLLGGMVVVSAVQLALSLGDPEPVAYVPPPPQEASIAVLPFANMSGDPAKEYFSDGISEELLSDLSQVPALRVAARTSSFAFKGRNTDIKEIARLLNVRTILEGSVRENGNRVRITAQLINAADGFHIWSATYDRELKDILAVEDEISSAITQALTHRLLGMPQTEQPRTIDPAAYRKFLEGQHFFAQRTENAVNRAIVLFKEATAIQPDFADAFGMLARANATTAFNFDRMKNVPEAEAAIRSALALDPNNKAALHANIPLAIISWDLPRAMSNLKRLRAISPRDSDMLQMQSLVFLYLGDTERALASTKEAVALDPLSVVKRFNLVEYNFRLARYRDALAEADNLVVLHPNNPFALASRCSPEAALGRFDAARRTLAQLAALGDIGVGGIGIRCRGLLTVAEGDKAKARALVEELARRAPEWGATAAEVGKGYQAIGDFNEALKWFERAYRERDPTVFVLEGDKSLPPIDTRNPGWIAFRNKPLIAEWQRTRETYLRELAADAQLLN
jgi:adenylate cyclase